MNSQNRWYGGISFAGMLRYAPAIVILLCATFTSGCKEDPLADDCDPLVQPGCALSDLDQLTTAAEDRCSSYDRDDYPYSQSVEDAIIAELGGIFSPYTGEVFETKYETDIEHMVATSEAHDSGLCAANNAERSRFASDLMNLTLASPELNRNEKRGYDVAEWQPLKNRCWFAGRVIAVRKKYRLTIDHAERQALENILGSCSSLVLKRD